MSSVADFLPRPLHPPRRVQIPRRRGRETTNTRQFLGLSRSPLYGCDFCGSAGGIQICERERLGGCPRLYRCDGGHNFAGMFIQFLGIFEIFASNYLHLLIK